MDARPKSAQENCDYLSAYRASMMIVSCIAILAVDFPAFPRSERAADAAAAPVAPTCAGHGRSGICSGFRGARGRPAVAASYEMPGKVMLHHYDLYRIDDTRSLGRLQLRERFTDAVCVVEWPEIIPEADLLAERLDVKLDICGDDTVPQTVLRDVKAADEGDDMDGDGVHGLL
eukprot:jgi/Pico_ML_1/52809/g3462.t1